MENFFEYVKSFYGVGGLYGMNFQDDQIKVAIEVVKISPAGEFLFVVTA